MIIYCPKSAPVFVPQLNKITQVYFNSDNFLPCFKYFRKEKSKGVQNKVNHKDIALTARLIQVSSIHTETKGPQETAEIYSNTSGLVALNDKRNTQFQSKKTIKYDNSQSLGNLIKMYETTAWLSTNNIVNKSKQINNVKRKKYRKRNNNRYCECPNKNNVAKNRDYSENSRKQLINKSDEIDFYSDVYLDTENSKIKKYSRKSQHRDRKYNAKEDILATPKSNKRKQKSHYTNTFYKVLPDKISYIIGAENLPEGNKELKTKRYSKRNIILKPEVTCHGGLCVEAKNKNVDVSATGCTTEKCRLPSDPVEIGIKKKLYEKIQKITKQYSPKELHNADVSPIPMNEKLKCYCRIHKVNEKIIKGKPDDYVCRKRVCENFVLDKRTKQSETIECNDTTCNNKVNTTKHTKKLQTLTKQTKDKKFNAGANNLRVKETDMKSIPTYDTRKSKRDPSEHQSIDKRYKIVQNATDQTGEPFFEMKVNASDMCILNENEVKSKVTSLGKQKYLCTCPSNVRKFEFTPRRVCVSGVCDKAQKNKNTYFNCKCRTKVRECTDTTCEGKNERNMLVAIENMKPLFDVNLDAKEMCIINAKEVQDNIMDFRNQVCGDGICEHEVRKGKTEFPCKCLFKKPKPTLIECGHHEPCTRKKKQNKMPDISSKIRNMKRNKSDFTLTEFTNETNKPALVPVERKIKNRIICLCRRYSRKLKRKPKDFIGEKSLYEDDHNPKIIGKHNTKKYTKKLQTLRKKTRNQKLNAGAKNLDDKKVRAKKIRSYDTKNFKCMLTSKHQGVNNKEYKIVQNAINQTGEPFFEMKVNTNNMCVLNEDEVKTKVTVLGKKKYLCTCPSNLRNIELAPRKICVSRDYDKTCNDKNTHFNYKSRPIVGECTEATYEGKNQMNMQVPMEKIKPLFNVNLDAKDMCIINAKEVQNNVMDFKNQVCANGICEKEMKYGETNFTCKCLFKKPQHTLNESSHLDPYRCKKKHYELKTLSSKMCSICSRILNVIPSQTQRFFKRDGFKMTVNGNQICKQCRNNYTANGELTTTNVNGDCICCACACGDDKKNSVFSKDIKQISSKIYKKVPIYLKYNKRISAVKNKENKTVYHKKHVKNKKDLTQENLNKITIGFDDRPQKDKKQQPENETTCKCYHECQCGEEMMKRKWKEHGQSEKSHMKRSAKQHKVFMKRMNREEKLRKKRQKMERKRIKIEIKELQKEMGAKETSCLGDFFMGTVGILFAIIIKTFQILLKLLIDPKGSYWYIKKCVDHPNDTIYKLKSWFNQWKEVRLLRIQNTIAGSKTLTILSDTVQNSALYQALASKGKTQKEKQLISIENKARKRRIRKRKREAITSCANALLHTMRRHPCMWFYHVFPRFYPQCLSCLALCRDFGNVLIFCCALMVWTPCIVATELCRALCCCLLCTG